MKPLNQEDIVAVINLIRLFWQIYKESPELVQDIRTQAEWIRKYQLFAPRVELINRESEQRAVRAVLTDAGNLRILYFTGDGGAGKTRLLQYAEYLVKESASPSLPLRWGGLIDMYHTEFHSANAIQEAMIKGLDPGEVYFSRYRKSQELQFIHVADGLAGSSIETDRQSLDELFLEEYQAFVRKYRPVIAFDTIESLIHESEWVENLYELSDPIISYQKWIIELIGKLENSVILMAGRPHPPFQIALEMANNHHPGQLELIELKGLTRKDSQELLNLLLKNAPPSLAPLKDNVDELWHITKGLPVQLALLIDLAVRGEIATHSNTNVTSNDLLGRFLVNELFSYEDFQGRVLLYLALARKGLTPDLLHYLEPEKSQTEIKGVLDELSTRSIIKVRPDSDELFLHDSLYEFFDIYSSLYHNLEPLYQRLADYHRENHLKDENSDVRHSKAAIKFLFYELHRNPRIGFEKVYIQLREKALRGYGLELDLLLRDELLRFLRSRRMLDNQLAHQRLTREEIDRDGIVHWIKRYVIMSRYEDAIRLSETIIALAPKSYSSFLANPAVQLSKLSLKLRQDARACLKSAPPLFWGQLLTYYCEALIYSAASEQVITRILQKAIVLLNQISFDIDHPLNWLRKRILGKANDRLGYHLRSKGQYGSALSAYEKAHAEFYSLGIEDEEATTSNNIAFVLALLGDSRPAVVNINRALELRLRLGQKYPLALSYNTRGLICSFQGQYYEGIRDCQLALSSFEELETPRGIGLAYTALGYILRKQGEGWKSNRQTPSQAIQCFTQSVSYFALAEEIFSKQISEPIRLWEVLNELGSLYREWGILLDEQRDSDGATAKYLRAIEYQMKALETAQQHEMRFQEADVYDDLAKVTHDTGDVRAAKRWLKRASSMVPKEFMLNSNKKRKSIPPAGEAYWLILGKIYFQEGSWAVHEVLNRKTISESTRRGLTQSAISNFALAAHCFEVFWPRTSANRVRQKHMADQILRLAIPSHDVRQAIINEGVRNKLDVSEFLKMFPAKSVRLSAGRPS